MKKKYKIIYEKNLCIGAGPCFLQAPKFWKLEPDLNVGSKAVLIGSKPDGQKDTFELNIEEKDFEANMKGARECPVKCIHIIDKKNGKKLI